MHVSSYSLGYSANFNKLKAVALWISGALLFYQLNESLQRRLDLTVVCVLDFVISVTVTPLELSLLMIMFCICLSRKVGRPRRVPVTLQTTDADTECRHEDDDNCSLHGNDKASRFV